MIVKKSDKKIVFLFKQKTAYEMRISDWSSDVCSSDLVSRLAGSPNARGFDRSFALLPGAHNHFGKGGFGPDDHPNTAALYSQNGVRVGVDRKCVVYGKSLSVRVDFGGILLFKTNISTYYIHITSKIFYTFFFFI